MIAPYRMYAFSVGAGAGTGILTALAVNARVLRDTYRRPAPTEARAATRHTS